MLTIGIKHCGLGDYLNILPRIKFGVTRQESSSQSPTISYRKPLLMVKQNKINHIIAIYCDNISNLTMVVNISLSRKNSLFCGSHAGGKRSALIYSLACSCRLHGINTFEYFTDVLNRMTSISQNGSDDRYRELLPN